MCLCADGENEQDKRVYHISPTDYAFFLFFCVKDKNLQCLVPAACFHYDDIQVFTYFTPFDSPFLNLEGGGSFL